jgi:hypothetical protein
VQDLPRLTLDGILIFGNRIGSLSGRSRRRQQPQYHRTRYNYATSLPPTPYCCGSRDCALRAGRSATPSRPAAVRAHIGCCHLLVEN